MGFMPIILHSTRIITIRDRISNGCCNSLLIPPIERQIVVVYYWCVAFIRNLQSCPIYLHLPALRLLRRIILILFYTGTLDMSAGAKQHKAIGVSSSLLCQKPIMLMMYCIYRMIFGSELTRWSVQSREQAYIGTLT